VTKPSEGNAWDRGKAPKGGKPERQRPWKENPAGSNIALDAPGVVLQH
jgi:hypothetical protein